VMAPYWGMAQALIRARIPYVPVHADHIARYTVGVPSPQPSPEGGGGPEPGCMQPGGGGSPEADSLEPGGEASSELGSPSPSPGGGGPGWWSAAEPLSVLVLPNVGALSDAQCGALRRFVAAGGGLVATGLTSRYDHEGEPRPEDFALAELFGAHATGEALGAYRPRNPAWDALEAHSYLRVLPELRAGVDGPHISDEPAIEAERHPVLAGFEATDLLPFGGRLERVEVDAGATVPLTYIAPFPIYPPETAWMPPEAETGLPALVINERAGQGRVVHMPASLDHAFARYNLPDHGHVLANLVRWAADGRLPLRVSGAGVIDCHLYEVWEPKCLVLHMVNLSHPGAWRAPLHELMPAGPFEVAVQLLPAVASATARCLVAGGEVPVRVADRWAHFGIASITDHEVVVIA
jgi:hypothetical protein